MEGISNLTFRCMSSSIMQAGNILIDRVGHVYLGDFGVSAHLTESHNKCNVCLRACFFLFFPYLVIHRVH